MRILIIGGAGFIGSHFSERAILGSHLFNYEKVTVLDKLTYAGNLENLAHIKSKKFEFIKGDILNSRLVLDLVKRNDLIVNFAAESHVDRSLFNPKPFISTNYLGVANLLQAIKNIGHKKFIQISTDEVYGEIISGSWEESDVLNPRSPYSATKAAADLLVMSYVNSFGIDACITRASNNFGFRQHPEKLIPNTITRVLRGLKVPIYGDGTNIRDWLHVEDHVIGIEKAIQKGKAGEIYHLGGENEISNIKLVNMILRIMNASDNVIEFVADRLGHDYRYSISCEKAKNNLGYNPSSSFKSKLENTVEWYSRNSQWWKKILRN